MSKAPQVPSAEKWLDVGCGGCKIPGAVGIDRCELPGVDVTMDLDRRPWPFPDSTFDHVVCKHSLSHLADFIGAIEEIYRVAKPQALVEILAPHYTSDNANTDPTIKTRVGIRTMNYFCEQYDFKYHYYSKARFFMERRWISFRECPTELRATTKANFARWIGLEHLVNAAPRIYERFFAYVIPASEVYFRLRALK